MLGGGTRPSGYHAHTVGGGIKRYRDPSVSLSVCLSHGAAALGAQLPRL